MAQPARRDDPLLQFASDPRMIAARRPIAALTRAAAQAIGLKDAGLVVIALA